MKFSVKLHYFLLVLGSLLVGCGEDKSDNEWLLEGEIRNYKGEFICLDRLHPDRVVRLDSVQPEDGRFVFRQPFVQGAFYQIRLGENLMGGFPFFPENDQLRFSMDESTKGSWRFEGNKATAIIREFVGERGRLFNLYKRDRNAMRLIPRSTTLDKWRNAEATADRSLITYREYLRGFIDTVSVPELRSYATFSMNPEANYYFLQQLHGRLLEELPQSEFTSHLGGQLASLGEPFLRWEPSDVVGQNIDGEEVNLRGERGKMTLLYFWAGYCEFSRMENKVLAPLYEAYKDKGFSIYAVSIDDLDTEWRRVCAEDNITWPGNIRVEKSWNSPVFADFNVPSIPSTFLLDHKGIIRTKNIRAAELEAQMEQLLEAHLPE